MLTTLGLVGVVVSLRTALIALERLRAAREQALREAVDREAFLSSVLAASTDCIKIVDLDGKLSFMSEGGMKMMEVGDFNAIRNCPWPDFMKGPDGVGAAREALEAAREGRSSHFEADADTYLGSPRHWSVSVSPIRGADGAVDRILSVSRDHTALRDAREQQRLLNGELAHRLKNVLTMVQSIASQTLRGAATLEEASAALSSRLVSLGCATDALTASSWRSAELEEVVEAGLAAVEGARDRVGLHGPRIRMNPQAALALTLALHELAANAIKYGALSDDDGRVELSWSVHDGDDLTRFVFRWRESGGPAVAPPTRKGFGSRMIERSLQGYFRGATSLRFPPEGAEFEIDALLAGAGEVVAA